MDAARRYARFGRRAIEGWLTYGACDVIINVSRAQERLGVSGNVAEIGVHQGRLFVLLALLTRESEAALAIDLFDDQERNIDKSGEGNRSKLMANLRRHAARVRAIAHQGDSTALDGEDVRHLIGGPIRLFSVDGGHTEHITLHDLETAERALTAGGVIVLDDCFNEGWPGVVSGASRFMKEQPRQVVPFAISCNKTLFTHPHFAEQYQRALALTPAADVAYHHLFGHRVIHLSYRAPLLHWLRSTRFWSGLRQTGGGAALRHIYNKARALR